MNVRDAKKMQTETYEKLKAISTLVPQLAIGLAPVNGTPVEVRKVPAADMRHLTRGGEATGMKYEGTYVIFVADQLGPAPSHLPSLTGSWLEMAVVFHEYGHIQEGDVFEDDPPRILARYQQPPVFDWTPVEERAECWKMYMLLDKAKADGHAALASEVQTDIHRRGLVRRP